MAARRGLPYVFAGHFAPQQMKEAIQIYKELFEPSDVLSEPYVIVCLNVIVSRYRYACRIFSKHNGSSNGEYYKRQNATCSTTN